MNFQGGRLARVGWTLLNDLLASTAQPLLLHGDLHHGNILRRGKDNWVVIDPKGIVGDIHFEAIQYLLNYVDRDGDVDEVLRRRVRIMAETLGLDPKRIAYWGIVRGVLEACWTLEDGNADWRAGIAISERFAWNFDCVHPLDTTKPVAW